MQAIVAESALTAGGDFAGEFVRAIPVDSNVQRLVRLLKESEAFLQVLPKD
jgi:hypothetical protein